MTQVAWVLKDTLNSDFQSNPGDRKSSSHYFYIINVVLLVGERWSKIWLSIPPMEQNKRATCEAAKEVGE